ncbi:MAG TPA: potassium transporter KefA, partial [Ruminococcaceae bacterium]|nr:potassium transporter KefA [Oscillospiraceae bacterium]
TGYATADFNKWPQFSRVILLLLMICGACAGSTGGGIKVSRAIIAFKTSKKGLKRVFHPQSIENVRVDGKTVDNQTVASVSVFLVLYSIIFAASVLIVSLDGFDFGTTFSSVASCLNNIGPGLGVVGPAGNFSTLSVVSKITLTLDMLLGRLEIFPILALFSRFSWKKTHYSRGAFTA